MYKNPLYVAGAVFLVVVVLGFFYITSMSNTERVFLQDVERASELGKGWLFANLRDKGLFVYSFNPLTGEVSTKNNAIRQLMGSRILAQESHGDEALRELHKKNVDFLMEFWYREDVGEGGDEPLGYVFYNDKSKLGANAMLLRVLVASPFFDAYGEEAARLARGILSLQDDTGAFHPWYVEPAYSYDAEYLLTFYSGEALLALVEYYEKVREEMIREAAIRSADFYVDRYVTHLEENYYPAYVPWHTLALNKLYKITRDKRYADAIFVMNDVLLELQDTTQFVGRFYNKATPEYGSPHSSSDGVYSDGLAYAYEVAKLVGDEEHEERYRNALILGVGNLVSLQYREPLAGSEAAFEAYRGALMMRVDTPWIRVDTTQHAVDAFEKILEVWR